MTTHEIIWSHGRAEVTSTAAMLTRCVFSEGGREFSPFARAEWEAEDVAELPGHLRVLGAEFICLPFGEGGSATRVSPGWEGMSLAAPNIPGHGIAADAEWQVTDERPGGITLRLSYAAPNPIAWLERRIDAIPGLTGLALSLQIVARAPVRTSVGLHPILRLPDEPCSLRIVAGFTFGLTYPADLVPGKTRAARGAIFTDLTSVPAEVSMEQEETSAQVDFSRLPFAFPTEEVLQLCGVTGPVVIDYLAEDASLTIDWDRELLPSAQLWVSDQALNERPWNGRYRGLGVEPIASAFDLADEISTGCNPISARGIRTAIGVRPGTPVVVKYSMVASLRNK